MRSARFRCYLAGGRPEGAARTYPGCRDPRPPAASALLRLSGALYFAAESEVWTGGMAFYDPDAPDLPDGPDDPDAPDTYNEPGHAHRAHAPDDAHAPGAGPGAASGGASGRVLVRAHLITAEQFSDVVAQEMHRAPGTGPHPDVDLAEVLAAGRVRLGDGRYETLVHPGDHEGVPVVTFTAPWGVRDVAANPPSPAYLAQIAGGLVEAGAGDPLTVAHYLARWPGVAGHWDVADIAALVRLS
ncbi:histone deacetylase [Streptomyces sp. DW26H14]|uniref:histone deacetylase n=1 Tax=Streptomyces sp. DW26H14 TaxID=3435395 RepID=UPI00403DD9A9